MPFSSEYDSYGMDGKLVTSKYASHGNRVLGAAAVLARRRGRTLSEPPIKSESVSVIKRSRHI